MKLSIKTKLFLVITAVFSINIAAVLLFGGTFLERYYVWSVEQNLVSDAADIKFDYTQDRFDLLTGQLQQCAMNNISVLIYRRDSNQIIYSTVHSQTDSSVLGGIDARQWISQAMQENIFWQLEQQNPIVKEENNTLSDSIYLYSKMNQNTYLFMETPREHIETIAGIAMRFFLLVCLFTWLIGIVAVYFVSKRIAKPIRQIDFVAQRISAMDFSDRCEIHTGDEMEELSNSVNKMAEELSKNIDLLRKDLEREEQTNRIRQEFVANVSHDFKTPLSLITAYTEALKDGSMNEQEVCEVLTEQCGRMNRLVTQMLTLSQLESGMIRYDMSVFSLNELLRTVMQEFRLILQQQDIAFFEQIEEEYIVCGDYYRIEQVVTNLFENALKYVDERHRVWLRVFREDAQIFVVIGNSHLPLSEEEQQNVFEIFYRVDSSRENTKKGHGIGLAIVKSIVQAHQGSYGVNNCEDGVEFWFTLCEASDAISDNFEEP